jgi:hypothetical protein
VRDTAWSIAFILLLIGPAVFTACVGIAGPTAALVAAAVACGYLMVGVVRR